MKTTFKTKEIAHVWAHKSAPFGKSPSALSFEGDCLLSYNTAIARHIEHKGKHAILINESSLSNPTSKHQNLMRRAIPSGVLCFYVSDCRGTRLDFDGPRLFAYAIQEATDASKNAAMIKRKGTQKQAYLEARQALWLQRAKEVSDFFGLRRKVDEKTISRLEASSAKAEKKAKAAREKQEAARREKYQAAYASWLNGGKDYFPEASFPVAFRVEGDELVSTLGARVPLQAARVAYRFVTSKRGHDWRQNGETCPVGNYAVNAINGQGIVAGCHRVTWAELERLASILG